MDDIDTKVFKLLKQMKLGKKELAEFLDTSQRQINFALKGMAERGVDISWSGKGRDREFYISSAEDVSRFYVISPASTKREIHKTIVTSDWHVGSMQFDRNGLEQCLDQAIKEGAEHILHAGDIHDGHQVYRGHLSNLAVWRLSDQTDLSAKIIDPLPVKVYGIGGNHDDSYTRKSGIRAAKVLSMKTKNFEDMGDFWGTVVIGGVEFRLLHGAGGNAYAQSYPAQKFLRNLAEGSPEEVPEVLVLGHYHTNPTFQIYGCLVIHPGNFQKPNDFTMRRGLRGPEGLYLLTMETQYGDILNYNMKFIKPRSRR